MVYLPTRRQLLLVAFLFCTICGATEPTSSIGTLPLAGYSILAIGAVSFTIIYTERSATPDNPTTEETAAAIANNLDSLPTINGIQPDEDIEVHTVADNHPFPVPAADAPLAHDAEAHCLASINKIRVDGGLSELLLTSIIAESQSLVSHGMLYDFILDVTDGSGEHIHLHFDCEAVHNPTNSSAISDFVVEGIPEPESIFPQAWLDQAHEAQEAAAELPPVPVVAALQSRLPGDETLQEQTRGSKVSFVQRYKLGHQAYDAGMQETPVDLIGVSFPVSYNSHTEYPHCVSHVQDQGACGCCYAFATATALSERQCIYMTKEAIAADLDPPPGVEELAQQPLISCGRDISIQGGNNCPQNFTSACDGGNGGMTLQFIATYGLDRSASYPFVSGGGSAHDHFDVIGEYVPHCETDRAISEKSDNTFVYSISKSTDDTQIMAAIQAEGAVYIGFTVYEDIWDYDAATIYDPDHSLPMQGGHAVVAYGWGAENGVKYWNCRNSWGPEWGGGGDFRLRRGTGLVNEAYWGSVDPLTPDPTDTSGTMPDCMIATGAWYASVDPGVFEFQGQCYFTGTNNCDREVKLWGNNWGLQCLQEYVIPPGETRLFNAPCDLNLRMTMAPLMPAFTGPPMTFEVPNMAGTDIAFTGPTDQPTSEPTLNPTEPTEEPTAEPTVEPSSVPTHMPTLHACDDGSHGCDTSSTQCEEDDGTGFTCACLEGFVADESSDTSCMATASPTPEPTEEPTPEPTVEPSSPPTHMPSLYPSSSPTYMNACSVLYMGDGYCDSGNNNEECDFDGGDCCGSTCTSSVYNCGDDGIGFAECIDPSAPVYETSGDDATDDTAACADDASWVYMTAAKNCAWAAGNSWRCRRTFGNEPDGAVANDACPVSCGTCPPPPNNGGPSFSPTQKPTTRACIKWWVGDGHCDPINNVLQCQFDGGDCCEGTCSDTQAKAVQSSRGPFGTGFTCGGGKGFNCIDPAAADDAGTTTTASTEEAIEHTSGDNVANTEAAIGGGGTKSKAATGGGVTNMKSKAATGGGATNMKSKAATGGGVTVTTAEMTVIGGRKLRGKTVLDRILGSGGAASYSSAIAGVLMLVSAAAVFTVAGNVVRRRHGQYESM
jgi:cathepsin B